MARIRTIKPEFFEDENIAEQLSDQLKLLWIGIWTLCDRDGKMEDRPKFIESKVFPYNKINIEDALNKLHNLGYIQRYAVQEKKYIKSKNFLKYQKPHPKESSWNIPDPEISPEIPGMSRVKVGEVQRLNGLMDKWINGAKENLGRDESGDKPPPVEFNKSLGAFHVPTSKLDLWKETYTAIEVQNEIKKAGVWAAANPKKAKGNWERFLVGWLSRSHDAAMASKKPKNPPQSIIRLEDPV